jgi:hypothetical protein
VRRQQQLPPRVPADPEVGLATVLGIDRAQARSILAAAREAWGTLPADAGALRPLVDVARARYCAGAWEVGETGRAYAALVRLGLAQGLPRGEAVRCSVAVLWAWETRRLAMLALEAT